MSRTRAGAVALAVAGVLFLAYPAVRPWHDETTVAGATRSMGSTAWVADGTDTLVLTQWPGSPRFTKDPTDAGALVATPGMYSSAPEQWLPGATCLICPVGDAGVAVACAGPAVDDAASAARLCALVDGLAQQALLGGIGRARARALVRQAIASELQT